VCAAQLWRPTPPRPAPPPRLERPTHRRRGYNIGQRLIDEYLAKTKTTRCSDFRDTADKIAKVGFKMFLNTTAAVTGWNAEGTECRLVLDDNPLADFVELPEQLTSLRYSNLLCGVVRGALEMVNIEVECEFVKDALRGDDTTEMRLKLVAAHAEQYPFKDDD
jgi:hypothetical protein